MKLKNVIIVIRTAISIILCLPLYASAIIDVAIMAKGNKIPEDVFTVQLFLCILFMNWFFIDKINDLIEKGKW